jgi:hypothetical protein
MSKEKKLQPPQHQQKQHGREHKMKPRPRAQDEKHRGSGKLQCKIAIITGRDSGIGRAVAKTPSRSLSQSPRMFRCYSARQSRLTRKLTGDRN